MPKERIGIMGGSFNPIHERHMELACSALAEYRLNRVLFIPTGNPPHKHDGLAPAEDRYEMTRLAVSGKPGFGASRVELDRKGVIYTVDTLTRLSRQTPGAARPGAAPPDEPPRDEPAGALPRDADIHLP